MTPQEVLLAAAELVETPGVWIQGDLVAKEDDGTVRCCAYGALDLVSGFLNEELDVLSGEDTPPELLGAMEALFEYTGRYRVAEWNDAPERTAADVAATMRRAAKNCGE